VFDTMRGAAAPPLVDNGGGHSAYVLVEVAVPAGAQAIALTVDGATVALERSADGFASVLVRRDRVGTSAAATLRYVHAGVSHSRSISLSQ
jgi:hypothetical protein